MGRHISIDISFVSNVEFGRIVEVLLGSNAIRAGADGLVMYLGLPAVDPGDWAADQIKLRQAAEISNSRCAMGRPAAIAALRPGDGESVTLLLDQHRLSVLFGRKAEPDQLIDWNALVAEFVVPLL